MKERVREWKEFLLPYQQAVDELKVKFKAIRKEYRETSKYSPIEFVTGRVKKISSIIEKCERRNIDIDDIQEVMEDIAGIRIMCQFKDDIYNVVDLIHKRSGKDLEVLYEKDYIANPKERIEHSLNYKYKKDIPADVKSKLVNAAKAVTILDDEVCGIRDEIINAQQIFELI